MLILPHLVLWEVWLVMLTLLAIPFVQEKMVKLKAKAEAKAKREFILLNLLILMQI